MKCLSPENPNSQSKEDFRSSRPDAAKAGLKTGAEWQGESALMAQTRRAGNAKRKDAATYCAEVFALLWELSNCLERNNARFSFLVRR
jgi:hypothetical protein